MRILKIPCIRPFSASARSKFLIAGVAIVCFTTLSVWGTPGAGFLFNIILSRGSMLTSAHEDIFVETDTVNGSPTPNNNQGDNWSVKFKTSGPSDIAVQDVALDTGGFSGWHYHPGLLLATVMGSPARNPKTVHFADYILDFETAELRRNGTRIILQDQPFQILTTLIESQGRLVTREELIKKLWPDGTFVDFDQSLNRAVGRLREALGDNAEHPRFVETLPRRGYRFVAPLNARTEACESVSGSVEEVNIGRQGELQQVERAALTRLPNWWRPKILVLLVASHGNCRMASLTTPSS